MKNEEKYKTADARHRAFLAFCDNRVCSESSCEIFCENDRGKCKFKWLELEDEETPKPCPCCGARAYTEHPTDTEFGYKVVCGRCGLQTGLQKTKSDAVALWNRRVK